MAKRRRGHGEGSISRRQDGRWEGRVRLPRDGDGRVRRHVVYGRTKAEVQNRIFRLKAEAAQGILPDPSRATVREYLTRWLEDVQRPAVGEGTYVLQKGHLEKHVIPRIGHYRLDALRAEHVDWMLGDLERSGASANLRQKCRAVLHRALEVAVKRRRIPYNPVAATTRPRADRPEVRALRGEEARRLLTAAREDRLWALFALAVTTGMRQGELFALSWGDLDLERGVLHVRRNQTDVGGRVALVEPKTEKARRTIALGALAVQALREHRRSLGAVPHPTAPVFMTRQGGRLRKQNFRNRVWLPLLRRAGLPEIGFHAATRHTMATLSLEAGIHPKVVQERLGHSRIDTTLDVYSHVAPELQRQAASALDAALGGDDHFDDQRGRNAGTRRDNAPS